jgi:hypothetical protein
MRTIRITVVTAALLLAGAAAGTTSAGAADTVYSGNLKIQQVISGGLTVLPTGDNGYPRLSVGYAYRIAALPSGASAKVTVNSPAFEFSWRCVSDTTQTGKWHINTGSATRTVSSTAWYPSANQKDKSTLQNTAAVPNSCNDGKISVRSGTFVNAVTTTQPQPVSFRWHYVYCTSSATCTSGAWTQTFTVTPLAGGVYPPPAVGGLHLVRPVVKPAKPLPFTGTEIGAMVTGGLLLLGGGTFLVIVARRRRRERAGW